MTATNTPTTYGYCVQCGAYELGALVPTSDDYARATGKALVFACHDTIMCNRRWAWEMDARAGREPRDFGDCEPEPLDDDELDDFELEARNAAYEAAIDAAEARKQAAFGWVSGLSANADDLPFD